RGRGLGPARSQPQPIPRTGTSQSLRRDLGTSGTGRRTAVCAGQQGIDLSTAGRIGAKALENGQAESEPGGRGSATVCSSGQQARQSKQAQRRQPESKLG